MLYVTQEQVDMIEHIAFKTTETIFLTRNKLAKSKCVLIYQKFFYNKFVEMFGFDRQTVIRLSRYKRLSFHEVRGFVEDVRAFAKENSVQETKKKFNISKENLDNLLKPDYGNPHRRIDESQVDVEIFIPRAEKLPKKSSVTGMYYVESKNFEDSTKPIKKQTGRIKRPLLGLPNKCLGLIEHENHDEYCQNDPTHFKKTGQYCQYHYALYHTKTRGVL